MCQYARRWLWGSSLAASGGINIVGSHLRARPARRNRRRRQAVITTVIAVLVVAVSGTAAVAFMPGLPKSLPPAAITPSPAPVAEPVEPVEEPPAPVEEPVVPEEPVSPAALACTTTSLMSVWAHQDDDLIFANPDISAAIAGGECVRTLYLTAGDAGRGAGYSTSRELGILRSYNVMRGAQSFWDEHTVTLLSGAELTMFTPQGSTDTAVAFLRLPDGGLSGGGFSATGHTSMPMLLNGSIATIAPIDGGPPVSAQGLGHTISELISAWAPTRLFTHTPGASTLSHGDHPDHAATGTLTRQAWQSVGYPVDAVRYFVGYPSEYMPVNVSGDVLTHKVDIYRTYANEDVVIACADNAACLSRRGFGAWLQRSYPKTDAELGIG